MVATTAVRSAHIDSEARLKAFRCASPRDSSFAGAGPPAHTIESAGLELAVLIEGISVVAQVATIEAQYPSGLAGFVADRPNQTLCCDDELVRVGFMAPGDVGEVLDRLRAAGFDNHDLSEWLDAAVVDQRTGPTLPCRWLAYCTYDPDIRAAYLTGSDPGELIVPEVSEYEGSLSDCHTCTANENVDDVLVTLDDSDDVQVIWDKRDQTVKYVGRSFPHAQPSGLDGDAAQ